MKSLLLLPLVAIMLSCSSTAPDSTAGGGGGVKSYPLTTCLVTDNALGSMGPVQRIVHQNQEIKFCCSPCIGKFKANPEKYLVKLR